MKSLLAIDFAKRAEELDLAAKTLLDSTDFEVSRKTQSLFIVGQVTANVMHVMADMVGFLAQTGAIDEVHARRAKLMEANNAIRLAAAAGNWERFNELVKEFGGSEGDGT